VEINALQYFLGTSKLFCS